jgi:hypothetical protein
MMPAWIIEQIKKQEKEKQEKEDNDRPRLEILIEEYPLRKKKDLENDDEFTYRIY